VGSRIRILTVANLLVKEIEKDLLREVNYAASGEGLTQREWVIKVLMEAVNGDDEGGGESGGSRVGDSKSTNRSTRRAEATVGEQDGDKDSAIGGRNVVSQSRVAKRSKTTGEPYSGEQSVKRLTAEQFFALSKSAQMKARREGRFK
jgi:hypothetical protein